MDEFTTIFASYPSPVIRQNARFLFCLRVFGVCRGLKVDSPLETLRERGSVQEWWLFEHGVSFLGLWHKSENCLTEILVAGIILTLLNNSPPDGSEMILEQRYL
jgi:hypothetical protein